MTRTQSKARQIRPTTTIDPVEALIAEHAEAARDHLAEELRERAEIDRDISFAIMVTSSGAGR